jgi:hypothetical protein
MELAPERVPWGISLLSSLYEKKVIGFTFALPVDGALFKF